MIPLPISQNLTHWAVRAGYAVTPVDPSGAAVFWTDPGGEVRVYLREDSSGWITVSSADRAEDERFDLSAASLDVAERYLWKFLVTAYALNVNYRFFTSRKRWVKKRVATVRNVIEILCI